MSIDEIIAGMTKAQRKFALWRCRVLDFCCTKKLAEAAIIKLEKRDKAG